MISELPVTFTSYLELGDGLTDTLGVERNDLLDSNFITPQKENDVVLEQIKEDYNFDEIKVLNFFMVVTMKTLFKMLNF